MAGSSRGQRRIRERGNIVGREMVSELGRGDGGESGRVGSQKGGGVSWVTGRWPVR